MQSEFRLMEGLHREYFQRFAGPDGQAWPPNSPGWVRIKGHGIILVYKQRLKPAMTEPNAEHGIRVTVDNWPRATMIFGNDLFYSPMLEAGRNGKKYQHVGLTPGFFDGQASRALDYAYRGLQK